MNIKRLIRIKIDKIRMIMDYYYDYAQYSRWNYNNPKVLSQNAYQAKILRQTHTIEKGLSLSSPKKGFGLAKIEELFLMLDEYLTLDFSTNNIPFQNAIRVVNEYVRLQKDLGYENENLNAALRKYQKFITIDFDSGIKRITKKDIFNAIEDGYPSFCRSRHSVRQFSEKPVDFSDIKKAVLIAQKSPTACNRQACKVYFYKNESTNRELGKYIAGNTGFDSEVKNYLVITADISAFYDSFERNQLYVETGIFVMGLVQALHYYGIASCILQNGEFRSNDKQLRKICPNIPLNEKVTVFVAIGYYKDEFSYAVSARKDINDVLICENTKG